MVRVIFRICADPDFTDGKLIKLFKPNATSLAS